MNASIYRISLDIHEAHSGVSLSVKRGDTNRKIFITLTDGGFPYQISEDCYAVFTATKPDGNIIFNRCTIENNIITYDITLQTTVVEGMLGCELKLYGADDQLITSPEFVMIVDDTVYNEGEEFESFDEVDALTHLVSEATEVISEGKEVNAEGKALAEELEAHREEFEQRVTIAVESAESAEAAKETAVASATAATSSEANAKASEENAKASETASATSEQNAKASEENAKTSEQNAKASEDNAKKYADLVDADQINANIESKADDLYFDSGTSLLYLTSNGQIIGSGVKVATAGGGGGGGGGSSDLVYTIAVKNLLESRVITVSEGTKVELLFSYESVDGEGGNDGPGIGRVIVGNVTRQSFTAVQGVNSVDVTSFLSSGSNTVKIQVENSEDTKKTLSYTITVATAHLTSTFDVSAPFTGDILFNYIPTGIGEKTVHFELDGAEIDTATVTVSGRQQNYTIPAQSHGVHTLRVWFICKTDGIDIPSNELYYQIICTEEGKTDPVIAVNSQIIPTVEQFTNIVKKYRVYDPTNMTAAITLEVNGEVVASLTVDRTEQTWTYRPTEVGELVQTIRCGDIHASWSQTVVESNMKVSAETEALALHLSSYGRSNSEENPGVWTSGNVECEFRNFNFVSDGWKQDEDDVTVCRVTGDARLYIPYKMFAYDYRTTGKTIEFELATREVLDYDTEVINCFNNDRGFSITAQQLFLASAKSKLGLRYKEDEHIRVTFVTEKQSEDRLLLCYINGIMSGVVQYAAGDDFQQLDPVGITIGSNYCTTDLYNIRVYDNNLTRWQVLDNWIADTQNPEERMARFMRNQIYDAYGKVVISQLPTDLCYMVISCKELPQYKGDKKTCNGYFVDLVRPERSFSFTGAEIDVQGTSSQYYYRKNYKIKFKGGFILTDGSAVTVYQMNDNAVPVNTFTMKADVASSEGAFNVVLAMLYDDLCPYKTPAQDADPRVRQTIEGFPIVIFWDNGAETKFLGKYNFNNDKGTESVFGFQNGDESWEIKQNGTDRVGWHSADFSGDGWQADFEARYPDKNTNITKLQQLAEWLVSTDTDQATGNAITPVTYDGVEYTVDSVEYRLAKFSAELSDHFVEEAIIFYYLFTEIFLSIDQREKNAFPTYIASLDRWIVLFYDADSSLGTDNKGNLTFDYYLEDIDFDEGGNPIYNGQNSVLWKNLRSTRYAEIMEMYQNLRSDDALSYESVIGRFEAHQSKWPEAIFNEDMHTKCIEPLQETGTTEYLHMMQGKKEMWMKWWLYNRFRYLDSKYVTGSSTDTKMLIRAKSKANVFLTPYVNMYGHVAYNASVAEHRMERGKEYEFEWLDSGAEDPVIGINDADLLTSIGDLSPLMVERIDISGAPRLTSLKVGDGAEDYVNYALTEITLGNNILLRSVDLRNCVNLTQSVDASGCTNIEEIYLDGTSVTGVTLPNGGILKKLHLPATVTDISVCNQSQLTDFQMPDYSNITTLRTENAGCINPMEILPHMADNSRVRILGINLEAESSAQVVGFLEKLTSMRGLDENGNNMEQAQVSGYIHMDAAVANHVAVIEEAKSKYPSLTIEYDEVRNFIVRFYNGETLLETHKDVPFGASVTYTGATPTKEAADETEEWRFMGWSEDNSYVDRDMDCQAEFANVAFDTIRLVERTLSGEYENDRVTTIGEKVFFGCKLTGLSFQNVVGNIPCIFSTDYNTANRLLKNISFPNADGNVEDYAFQDAPLENIHLPKIKALGYYSMSGVAATFVDFPELENFGAHASFWTTNLTTLVLRREMVVGTYSINSIILPKMEAGTGWIYVPRSVVDQYKSATVWSAWGDQYRALEDWTVDGTITGELDWDKINGGE